jgi:UDP-N-acetylglucosamine 1-carboxyvinyltransferase
MEKILIRGGNPLNGTIEISGAKNAALPLICASLLSEAPLTLTHMPHLADVASMTSLMGNLGVAVSLNGQASGGHEGAVLELNAAHATELRATYDVVRKMRASVLVLGPLLARHGEAYVSLPGGCAIGTRPIDLHLHALEQMGATIALEDGYVHAKAEGGRLKGAEIHFPKVTVGATENLLMAASLAKGTTVLHNAAREPEIGDLAHCLNAMGAKITGIGSDTLTIDGVDRLHAATHRVLPDRIELGTYIIAAAMTHGQLYLHGGNMALLGACAESLQESGVELREDAEGIHAGIARERPKAVDIETQPFPGFATDMQAQFMALMSVAEGTAILTETIFENRFMHVPELTRMGADITLKGHSAIIKGVERLKGAPVMATDLRASVAMILAGLVAEGETEMQRIYHLDRGYERLEEKLSRVGADIRRVSPPNDD